jgi:hypothetical protein
MMSAKVSDAALTQRARDPYKIGICMEFAGGTRLIQDFYDAIRLVGDEYFERGELDRPVEFVIREVMGPMRGTNPVVVEAWRDLAFTENCLAIIGPEVTEANLAILDLVNSSGVPTISFCATADWAGPYAYALQNGCFPDESNLLAAYMAKQGLKRVGVFHEEGISATSTWPLSEWRLAGMGSRWSAITWSGSSTLKNRSSRNSLSSCRLSRTASSF